MFPAMAEDESWGLKKMMNKKKKKEKGLDFSFFDYYSSVSSFFLISLLLPSFLFSVYLNEIIILKNEMMNN